MLVQTAQTLCSVVHVRKFSDTCIFLGRIEQATLQRREWVGVVFIFRVLLTPPAE